MPTCWLDCSTTAIAKFAHYRLFAKALTIPSIPAVKMKAFDNGVPAFSWSNCTSIINHTEMRQQDSETWPVNLSILYVCKSACTADYARTVKAGTVNFAIANDCQRHEAVCEWSPKESEMRVPHMLLSFILGHTCLFHTWVPAVLPILDFAFTLLEKDCSDNPQNV